MVSLTKVDMSEIFSTYDGFKDVNTLVDLGGGHGEVISRIVAVYPHIHGINFDLPNVIRTAPILPGMPCQLFCYFILVDMNVKVKC